MVSIRSTHGRFACQPCCGLSTANISRFTRVPIYSSSAIRAQRPFAQKFITPSSALLRPHVPVLLPLTNCATRSSVSLRSLDHPLLVKGPSRRYLCKSFTGCLDPYPGGLQRCSYPFLPAELRPSPLSHWVGARILPYSDFSTDIPDGAAVISLCSGLLLCLPPRSLPPMLCMAAVAFTPEYRSARCLTPRQVC